LVRGKKGAIVVSTPDGKILSLVSSPSFNPEVFIKAIECTDLVKKDEECVRNTNKLKDILSSSDQPLFNRAIAGLYPPGSTFKIVTSVAALEVGVINKDTKVEDTGQIEIGPYTYANWYFTQYGKKEGFLDLVKAIKRSNDIFFYKTGEWLGITKLSSWAREFGLGRKTGIILSGEEGGLVPDASWKKEVKKESWYLGDTYITSIGQGDLQTTPLQINQMASVIANNGLWCKPLIVDKFFSEEVFDEVYFKPECRELPILQETIELVREGMREACEVGGTGWPLFKFQVANDKLKIDDKNFFIAPESTRSAEKRVRIPVACKTGTAETYEGEEPHAWFTVFAPVYDPEIVVTVLLEKAGEGSYEAAPVAYEILKEWFEGKDN
jgi:penicillin-binding protein 2